MPQVQPTFETIFSQEYWEEPRAPEKTTVGSMIPGSVLKQMHTLTSQAAAAIFAGEPRSPVPEAAVLGLGGNSFHTLPGTVLLTDLEMLMRSRFKPSQYEVEADEDRLFHRHQFIHHEGELMALPSTLFMRNSREWDGPEGDLTVYPYAKSVINEQLDMQYGRMVVLMAYGVDKHNDTTYRFMRNWEPVPGGRIKGSTLRLRDVLTPAFPPMEIGQAYNFGNKTKMIMRFKSAEICLSGTIEYAKAKKKARRGLFAGKLAVARHLA